MWAHEIDALQGVFRKKEGIVEEWISSFAHSASLWWWIILEVIVGLITSVVAVALYSRQSRESNKNDPSC